MSYKEGTEVSWDIDSRTSNEMDLNNLIIVIIIVSEVIRDIDPGASALCLSLIHI